MPKVLIAGEKSFAVHSFSEEELNQQEITETRNVSVAKIGKVFDQSGVSEEQLDTIKASIIMLLKQSTTYRLETDSDEPADGYILTVFRLKNQDGRKVYIATWLGRMDEKALTTNPQHLIQQLVKNFSKNFNLSEFHKKSIIHSLV